MLRNPSSPKAAAMASGSPRYQASSSWQTMRIRASSCPVCWQKPRNRCLRAMQSPPIVVSDNDKAVAGFCANRGAAWGYLAQGLSSLRKGCTGRTSLERREEATHLAVLSWTILPKGKSNGPSLHRPFEQPLFPEASWRVSAIYQTAQGFAIRRPDYFAETLLFN